MAATSTPRVNGFKSDGFSPDAASHDLKELQGLRKAILAISREDGFGRFTKLVERVNAQEADLKAKDGKIGALESQLAECKAAHSTSKKELFDQFEERHQQWRAKTEEMQSAAEAFSASSMEKDNRIAMLQGELNKSTVLVKDLEKACSAETKSVKNKVVQLAELDAQLKAAEHEVINMKARVKKAEDEAVALKKSLQEELGRNQKLQLEATTMSKKVEKYKSFTIEIESLDLPAIASKLESLWESAAALVQHWVGLDLPRSLLEGDWSKLNDNRVFRNRIPLPQNNSDIAKQMRIAVILGALAHLIVHFLFQPTYVLGERGGLRNLLRYQATIDPVKEVYTRGILLSMKHRDQDDIDEDKIDNIVDDMKDVVRVGVLFAVEEDLETFIEQLEDLLLEFQKLWKKIQRGLEKLEPSLDERPSTTKYAWYIVGLPVAADAQRRTVPHPATTKAQDDTIIVPQIVQMRTKGDPEPITRGWVLQKDQIHAAHDEIVRISRDLRTTPFVEETPSRPRTRPRRAMSISGNASPDQRRGASFLPSGSGA